MLTQEQLPIGAVVSFDLYPAQIIGASLKNAKVLAIVDGVTAKALGTDVAALHAAVYATLPVGVPNRFDGYSYVRLKLTSGETVIIGLPWIKESTLLRAQVGRLNVVLEGMSEQDYSRLTKAMSANGFKIASIDWVE